MEKYVAPTHHYGDITAMVKRDSLECDGGLAYFCGFENMKETIIYVSNNQKDIDSFLKYLQRKLGENEKTFSFDEKYAVLKTEKYDIVGKNIYGTHLGTGYGYCIYYCFSSNLDMQNITKNEQEKIKEVLLHVREDAKEVSELNILYILGLV